MAKYTKIRVNKICTAIAEDDYTVEELCLMAGISESTYYQWQADKPEFSEAIKRAEEKRLETFRKAARSGLLALLRGKEFEEVKSEYKEVKVGKDTKGVDIYKPKLVFQQKTKKLLMPNVTSVIFALKNLDEDNFRDILRSEHTGKDGGPIQTEDLTEVNYDELSDSALNEIVKARKKRSE